MREGERKLVLAALREDGRERTRGERVEFVEINEKRDALRLTVNQEL